MNHVVLLNQNGNPVTYGTDAIDKVRQIDVPNTDGGKTRFTDLTSLYVNYCKNAGTDRYEIIGSWFVANYPNSYWIKTNVEATMAFLWREMFSLGDIVELNKEDGTITLVGRVGE